MKWPGLQILGIGVQTDQYADAAALARHVADACHLSPEPGVWIGEALADDRQPADSSLDLVTQYAFAAIAQAWRAAGLSAAAVAPQRVALLFTSCWGAMDSTAAFLESMFDQDGRYASPRCFTRSVYSSTASLAAIRFGIQGPCETLIHDAWIVSGLLERAGDLLSHGRVDTVLLCWADQSSPVAKELCVRAVRALGQRQYERYVSNELGFGALALALAWPSAGRPGRPCLELRPTPVRTGLRDVDSPRLTAHPFPCDAALALAAAILEPGRGAAGPAPRSWLERDHRGQGRQVEIHF